MNVNLLAISIGNTCTRVGAFVDGQLSSHDVSDNAQLDRLDQQIQAGYQSVQDKPNARVMLASVNPRAEEPLMPVIAKLNTRCLVLEEDLNVPIGRQLDPETIVGVDRLLNAAAAYDVLKQSCVVVDAGTAVTVDFIDGAGTFHGGAIAPGTAMMLNSLHQHAALLPEVTMAVPDEPIGHSTTQAMLTGVYHGLRGMVRELVEQYAQAVGSFPLVVATGGDAQLLFHDDELIDRIVPDLTLRGMAVTLHASMNTEA